MRRICAEVMSPERALELSKLPPAHRLLVFKQVSRIIASSLLKQAEQRRKK
jgi:hypothetical protein